MIKKLVQDFLFLLVACLVFSLIMSTMRAMGHDNCTWESGNKTCPNTPCEPFYIDKLEPALSTRWFCEVHK